MPRVVRVHAHGGPEVLRYEQLEERAPPPGEVTMAVKAIGINRSEVMFRTGRHVEGARFPARLGYEAAGLIQGVGREVTGFSAGDRVCLVPPPSVTQWGTYAETVTVPADYVVKLPQSVSFVEAAATWLAAITAYGMVAELADARPGDDVLILAASSSVGLTCIQVAHHLGARAICTTRTRGKASDLVAAGADELVVTGEESLSERVLALTGGEGVRLVLDPVAGRGLQQVVAACALASSIMLYGELDPEPAPLPVLELIRKGITLRGFTFKEVVLDAARRKAAVAFVQAAVADGSISPAIDCVFPFDDIAAAHRYLESNTQFGKVVVEV